MSFKSELDDVEKKMLFEFSAREAYMHVENISKFGNRFAGSVADNETIEYLANKFREYGLQVAYDSFEVECFEENKAKLTIVVPDVIKEAMHLLERGLEASFSIKNVRSTAPKKEIECRAMVFSPSTNQPITSELVYVGYGKDEDYVGKDVSGKIVLFDRDPRKEKDSYFEEVTRAAKNGAVACIMANHKPWIFMATLESGLFEAEKRLLTDRKLIPAVVITSVDGTYLQHLIEKGLQGKGIVEATLLVDTTIKKKITKNVRAFLEGAELPSEKIIVCAHHDSEGTLGANGNASGLAVILELARVLLKHKPKRTIEFLATGAGEISSMGSWHYCRIHKDELANVRAVINVDMIGVGGELLLIKEGYWPDKTLKTPSWLYNFVKNVAESLRYVVKLGICELGTSDEGRFLDMNVPALFVRKLGDDYYHTPYDTPERVDANTLKVVAEIVGVAVWRLANMERNPPKT